MTDYIDTKDCAKLIRKALKESFPGTKFSVRISRYSGGSSIDIGWTDGPNPDQVEAVSSRFEGSYFDGMIDYKGSLYSLLDSKPVSFMADFIHTRREHSDEWVQKAIDSMYRQYRVHFDNDGISKPSVEDYRNGNLRNVKLSGLMIYGNQNLSTEIRTRLYKMSNTLCGKHSKTAGRVTALGNDGYSQIGALAAK